MGDRYRELIASAGRQELDVRLRQAAASSGDEELEPLELQHLRRILTNPALVLSSIIDVLQFGDLVDSHVFPSALRALNVDEADEAALRRALTVPDHVRLLGDKCLFETGVARRPGPRGLDLTDLGRRSYLRAASILDSLSDDPRLRRFHEHDVLQHLTIDEEIAFLTRCASRFPVHARLLAALLHGNDQRGLDLADAQEDTREPEMTAPDPTASARKEPPAQAKTGTALAERPRGALRAATPPPPSATDEADSTGGRRADLRIVAKSDEEVHAEQVRSLIAAERTVLFSTLDTEDLRTALKARVVHQEEAIDSLCDELALYSAGTQDPRKPASYFLVGPTGVGKNHLVETLCHLFEELWSIEVPYLELEGPEFTYPSDINELKGAARGFIRSDEEGIMTQFHERAHDKPFSVLLVDEVEKAHPQLRRFFLPIMDRGTMMDNRGRVLHFTGTTIFFTSNIGYSDASQRSAMLGFGDEEAAEHADRRFVEQQIRKNLSPEFINRVHLVHFHHLSREAVDRIFDLELGRIRDRYRDAQGLELSVTAAARAELLVRGYDRAYGARNLAKILNRFANIEVSKQLKREEETEIADVGRVLSYIREMRSGSVAMDLEGVRREVGHVSKIRVPHERVTIDYREGEFRYEMA